MEKIELSNSSLRAIENYIAGKKVLKKTAYNRLLVELNGCLDALANYVKFKTAPGSMQQYCDRLYEKYKGLRDEFEYMKDYYDNLTDWKKEFHRVGTNIDSEEEPKMEMKLVRVTRRKTDDAENDLKIEREVVERISKAMKMANDANDLVKSCSDLTKKMSFDFHKSKKIMKALNDWNEFFKR